MKDEEKKCGCGCCAPEHEHNHEHEHCHAHNDFEKLCPHGLRLGECEICSACAAGNDCACCSHEHSHGGEGEKGELLRGVIQLAAAAALVIAAVLIKNETVSLILYIAAYLAAGADVIIEAVRDVFSGHPFTENLLMTVASVAAFATGEYIEAVAVMALYKIGELLQSAAVGKSRASISGLLDVRPDAVNIERDGEVVSVSPEEVASGDIAVVKVGERIPVDGTIVSGETTLDTSALTGESLPRAAGEGDSVIGGCVNLTGLIRVRASGALAESTLSRILDIVEESGSRKSKAQDFITKFAKYYTPAVMLAAVLMAVVPLIIFGTANYSSYIYRAAVFLTISCPCALVISIPIGFFGGIGGASRKGVLFKGANYLELMGRVTTVVTDKTGTLTTGEFEVKNISPVNGFTSDRLLALCCAAEAGSNHPIARAILRAGEALSLPKASSASEQAGFGVVSEVEGARVLAGNARLMRENGVDFSEVNAPYAVVYVASDGVFAGSVEVGDTVKPSAAEAVRQLRAMGVRDIEMLTGDSEPAAAEVARQVGIDGYKAALLPDGKVGAFEEIQNRAGGVVAFVGDGINDAPVLARSDVGVAMGALGSDAAIEAADVVLMDDDLGKLAFAIRASRRTRRIVVENIVLALAVKLAVLVLGMFGMIWLWLAIIADTGVALLAVLNSLRALRQM